MKSENGKPWSAATDPRLKQRYQRIQPTSFSAACQEINNIANPQAVEDWALGGGGNGGSMKGEGHDR